MSKIASAVCLFALLGCGNHDGKSFADEQVAALVNVACFDPVPDPVQAGWTKEGNGTGTAGTPLVLADPSIAPGDFINYFCADSTIFNGDIVLTPHFSIDSAGLTVAPDGNTGIHVTINDGVKFARAFVIQTAGSTFKVALAVAGGGYSNGFLLIGSTGDFTLRRNADGSATLSVPNPVVGDPPLAETVQSIDLADSLRPATKTLEFGTASNVQASSVTRWDTLGLPINKDFPVGLTFTEMTINDVNNDKFRFRAAFTLAAGSDGINPVTEQVTLTASNGSGQFYSANLPPGSFENRSTDRLARWALTDAARTSSGIERFDILQGKAEIFFVDRRTSLPTQSFASVTLNLAIGNDSGSGSASLTEKPAGSGRWRL